MNATYKSMSTGGFEQAEWSPCISLLKGFPYEDAKTILKTAREMQSIWAGKVVDFGELHRQLLSIACREIGRQKRRLGGTFAVAHAVTSRENRDFCRKVHRG